jgi:hypothetical protein
MTQGVNYGITIKRVFWTINKDAEPRFKEHKTGSFIHYSSS